MHQWPDYGTQYEENPSWRNAQGRRDRLMDWTLYYIPRIHLDRVGNNKQLIKATHHKSFQRRGISIMFSA